MELTHEYVHELEWDFICFTPNLKQVPIEKVIATGQIYINLTAN